MCGVSELQPKVRQLHIASGLPELLNFEDWQEPAHRKLDPLFDYSVHTNKVSGRPLDLDLLHLHSEAVNAATTPIEHAKVSIRLTPSLIDDATPPLSLNRLLASIVADLFGFCTNVCALLLPDKWVDVFVEAGESLFPLVN
jgi:hypothetical protein